MYCEGSSKQDCTRCQDLYKVDPYTGDCVPQTVNATYWMLVAFTVLVVAMTVLTEYNTNPSLVFFENLSMYYILVQTCQLPSLRLMEFISGTDVVVTNMSSIVSEPVRLRAGSLLKPTSYFALN